jgi:chromosomal replication initiator protein
LLAKESLPAAVTTELADIWERIGGELRAAVPDSTYEVWLAPLRPVDLDAGVITLEAPAEIRAWIAERFGRVLQTSAAAVVGENIDVVVVERGGGGSGPPEARARGPKGASDQDAPAADHLNPRYTFDHFVIGDANRFAHAAALAVAENPGQAYNPLFIYGPPGVGKTHLLHSIGNYVRAYGGGLSVRYTTAERFTNEFVSAFQTKGAIERFKSRYRSNDVLLIDDVQFLQAKVKTEEEFFHTFNALYETGSQLVLTCDRLPRDMNALEDRLRERFEAGLLTDIRPPDLPTRMTVLRKRARHDALALTDETVLEVIAERISSNIRTLEGALIRVVAFASLTGRPLTPALAREVLGDLYPAEPGATLARVSIARIQDVTCEVFGISRDDLLSAGRTARLTWPRQVAMYLAREHTDETLPAIGSHFGGRNHTTVMHACKRTSERMASDSEAYETVRALTERLRTPGDDRSD